MVLNLQRRVLRELVDELLDRGYGRAAMPVLRSITGSVTGGLIAQRLSELDAEAARLSEAGERLRADNAVLRALVADLETVMARNAGRVDGIAPDLQADAVEAAGSLTQRLALAALSEAERGVITGAWNLPDPEAVNRLVEYVESGAWGEQLAGYPRVVVDTIQNQAIRGIVGGWNPVRTAREIRRVTEGLPVAQANTMMRTLQLQSYRSAAALNQQANADILDGQVRIASLDQRCCLACIALHGTVLDTGVRVDDHHNGRCTSIPVVKGRRPNVTTGPEWFETLSDAEQMALAGPGALDALRTGQADWRDFVEPYEDPVYGMMVRRKALKRL